MADVSKINGYNIKDSTCRADLASKLQFYGTIKNFQVNWVGTSGYQSLDLIFGFDDPNTYLMIKFTYAGTIEYYVTNDAQQTWTNIWQK